VGKKRISKPLEPKNNFLTKLWRESRGTSTVKPKTRERHRHKGKKRDRHDKVRERKKNPKQEVATVLYSLCHVKPTGAREKAWGLG